MTRYSRQDVLRILRLENRHLAAWEREGLIPALAPGDLYTFEHLSCVRALREMRDLRSRRMSARSIRAQVDAMQRVAGMRNALVESSAVRQGSRLTFRHDGALVDPLTRQLAFDFDFPCARQVQPLCERLVRNPASESDVLAQLHTHVQDLFVRAVQMEETPATVATAVTMYEQILELKPDHAAACINLGTIFYNQRDFGRAERMYRRATEADPSYALAFFDLGNVLDEMQHLKDAIHAYQRAIALVPSYADAHYNLALAFERQGERRRALRHWTAYVRLDPVGPWAMHARSQARKILALERLSIVSRGGRTVAAS